MSDDVIYFAQEGRYEDEGDDGGSGSEDESSDDGSSSDSEEGYDINDPRTREHEAYKIAQDNYGRARRRYQYGDHVDADNEPTDSPNEDGLKTRLMNAREARGWAFDEAERRYEWNARWTGGVHEGVEGEADKRMADVEELNAEIGEMKRQLDHARDAEAAREGSGSDSEGSTSDDEDSPDNDEEYDKNILEAREARERRYERYSDEEDEDQQGSGDEIDSEFGYDDEDSD